MHGLASAAHRLHSLLSSWIVGLMLQLREVLYARTTNSQSRETRIYVVRHRMKTWIEHHGSYIGGISPCQLAFWPQMPPSTGIPIPRHRPLRISYGISTLRPRSTLEVCLIDICVRIEICSRVTVAHRSLLFDPCPKRKPGHCVQLNSR